MGDVWRASSSGADRPSELCGANSALVDSQVASVAVASAALIDSKYSAAALRYRQSCGRGELFFKLCAVSVIIR